MDGFTLLLKQEVIDKHNKHIENAAGDFCHEPFLPNGGKDLLSLSCQG